MVDGLPKAAGSAQIRINQSDNSFIATENVSNVDGKTSAEPVFVKAARAEGGANSILYTGKVEF